MCWLLAFTLYSHGSAVAFPGSRCQGRCAWTLTSRCFSFSRSQFAPLSVVLCGQEAALFCSSCWIR